MIINPKPFFLSFTCYHQLCLQPLNRGNCWEVREWREGEGGGRAWELSREGGLCGEVTRPADTEAMVWQKLRGNRHYMPVTSTSFSFCFCKTHILFKLLENSAQGGPCFSPMISVEQYSSFLKLYRPSLNWSDTIHKDVREIPLLSPRKPYRIHVLYIHSSLCGRACVWWVLEERKEDSRLKSIRSLTFKLLFFQSCCQLFTDWKTVFYCRLGNSTVTKSLGWFFFHKY